MGVGFDDARSLTGRLFTPSVGLVILALAILAIASAELRAQTLPATDQPGAFVTILKWLPLILFGSLDLRLSGGAIVLAGQLGGFSLNIIVSLAVMTAGTMLGVLLGLALVARNRVVKIAAAAVTQFFRNTPWLVLLFFAAFVLPFQIRIAGLAIPLPDWCKAAVALTFPIMANIAEITRGAIRSIPATQWESAESLSFGALQTFRLVIMPQCFRRMTPPWMNWYAILVMESSLISIVGVNEAMTMTHDALSAENRGELLIPMYSLLLLLFFAYCYPIARWTEALERRLAVSGR